MEQVLVGMSGGVDSSAAALILMERYTVAGATMKLFDSGDIVTRGKTCCAITDVEDARRVCHRLGLDHHVFNFTAEFHREVMERFADGYARGETPNPCIDCNRFVKFPHLLRRAGQLGMPYIATGHYARIRFDEATGRYQLLRGLDREKDQSYVLYAMTQDELRRTLLPLGDKTKAEIRSLAEARGLVTADKPDSQDICFVPNGDYGAFLTEKMGLAAAPGEILDGSGRVLGRHQGAIRYTIGQRRGLGVAAEMPLYVTGKDMARNVVTVGSASDLMCDRFTVCTPNWVAIECLDASLDVTVMTRYRDKEGEATLHPLPNGDVEVRLCEPKRAVTPGQAAVFYQGDAVVGGGVIDV
ncbi:MAG: tRNA 2-thiouridine(34) synthase MnmA [Oscillospiraceae bacterium]|nr:tRNA 2-thiouridine(34) synthase MnmA [Oscillospiraceae bacterium]